MGLIKVLLNDKLDGVHKIKFIRIFKSGQEIKKGRGQKFLAVDPANKVAETGGSL